MSPSSLLPSPPGTAPQGPTSGWGGGAAPPASPCVPPGAATPRQGTPRRSGRSSHHPTLLITLSDYEFLRQDRRLDPAAGSHLPPHPSSPRGQHGGGGGLLCPPFLGANPTISNPTKVAQVPSVSPPPAQRSPQGHPGQQHHPGCSGDTGSPRLSPVMAGGGTHRGRRDAGFRSAARRGAGGGQRTPKVGGGG